MAVKVTVRKNRPPGVSRKDAKAQVMRMMKDTDKDRDPRIDFDKDMK